MSASKQVFTIHLPADPTGVSTGGEYRVGVSAAIRAIVRAARKVGMTFGDRP